MLSGISSEVSFPLKALVRTGVSLSLSGLPCLFFPLNLFFFKDLTYLFLERGEGREKERQRNINV